MKLLWGCSLTSIWHIKSLWSTAVIGSSCSWPWSHWLSDLRIPSLIQPKTHQLLMNWMAASLFTPSLWILMSFYPTQSKNAWGEYCRSQNFSHAPHLQPFLLWGQALCDKWTALILIWVEIEFSIKSENFSISASLGNADATNEAIVVTKARLLAPQLSPTKQYSTTSNSI